MLKSKSISKVVESVFNNPTAPYREGWVLEHIRGELGRLKVPFYEDRWGNIIAGGRSPRDLKNKVALVAHTDHPGFHLQKRLRSGLWKAKWYGGAPKKLSGAQLAIYNAELPGRVFFGTALKADHVFKNEGEFQIKVNSADDVHLDADCFGAFAFPGYHATGTRVKTRAADDLAGVAIILATLSGLKKQGRRHCVGIFTRAEETGFRGALGLVYTGELKGLSGAISLEASRERPGARIGHGPVIRLGDKASLFDTRLTRQLDVAAQSCLKKRSGFKVQRRIMDGGTCEATVFNLYQIPCTGLAVPLGNYHNQRKDDRPGPEYIDLRDVERGVQLCIAFFENRAKKTDPMAALDAKLQKEFRRDSHLLKHAVDYTHLRETKQ